MKHFGLLIGFVLLFGINAYAATEQRTANFDADPQWDAYSNTVDGQDFGYRTTNIAGGAAAGEIGGTVLRRAGFYGDNVGSLDPSTTALSATGTFYSPDFGNGNIFFGWFNSATVTGAWPTNPKDCLAFFTDGFGGAMFYAVARGGESSGFVKEAMVSGGIPKETKFTFQLVYAPTANGGNGTLTLTIRTTPDGFEYGTPAVLNLDAGQKDMIANLDRFGIFTQNNGGDNYASIYIDNLSYTVEQNAINQTVEQVTENFDQDPEWDAFSNTANGHDFGYQTTNNAGGAAAGEVGGTVAATEGYYAVDVGSLDPSNTPMQASGKFFSPDYKGGFCNIGWFNSTTFSGGNVFQGYPMDKLGFYVEGWTGHGEAPVNAIAGGSAGATVFNHDNNIRPDLNVLNGELYSFDLVYDPDGGAQGYGTLTLTLFDDQNAQYGTTAVVELLEGEKDNILNLDRFGIWGRNKGQSTETVEIYWDDLTYTTTVEVGGVSAATNWAFFE